MRFAFALTASLLLTACDNQDAKIIRQVPGTWKETFPGGVIFTRTMSFGGGFIQSIGQSNFLAFASQGTWFVTNGELIITFTNGEGTDRNGVRFFDPMVSAERYRIIHVDSHQLVGERDGHTNFLTR
jgi:hypothetical protein